VEDGTVLTDDQITSMTPAQLREVGFQQG